MKYTWIDDKKALIRATGTENREETFSLEDLAQEWINRKVAFKKAWADIVVFRKKMSALRTALTLSRIDLVDMDDLDTFQEVSK